MDKLIDEIYEVIKDYRSDDSNSWFDYTISPKQIKHWILQFDEELQEIILIELKQIFLERYVTKKNAIEFLTSFPKKIAKDLGFATPKDFLLNTDFPLLQIEGKSQDVMLDMFDEILQKAYGITLAECGSVSKNYTVYLDDVICTGTTVYSDISKWAKLRFDADRSNKEAVLDGATTLIILCIFYHEKNIRKKLKQFEITFSAKFRNKLKLYRIAEIDNSSDFNSEVIMPLEGGQTEIVQKYKAQIIAQVNETDHPGDEEFYRSSEGTFECKVFSCHENRVLFENAILNKGIEILDSVSVVKKNMRALGFTLPSHKNFGFGALCFTWRNIPNNAPLVFWYSSGKFTPLFKVKR